PFPLLQPVPIVGSLPIQSNPSVRKHLCTGDRKRQQEDRNVFTGCSEDGIFAVFNVTPEDRNEHGR
ncbi:unnamed protein product, partial [Rotaria magnacalcarata]